MSNASDAEIGVHWKYDTEDRYFHWTVMKEAHLGKIAANFGSGDVTYPFSIKFLEPEMALGEALFF